MNRWRLLIAAWTVALPLTALAEPEGESNVRRSMWKVWRSTVTAPRQGDPEDPGQTPQDPDSSPKVKTPSDASDAEAGTSQDASMAKPARALPRLEPNRERLIPVQLPLIDQEQPESPEPDSAGRSQSPRNSEKNDSETPHPETPRSPETQERPSGPPPVRLAQTQPDPPDPQTSQETDPRDRAIVNPILDDGTEHEVPPALVAALKMAQVSSADQVRDPAGLADRLYRRKLYRPAEFFYRTALVRQKDVDRPWVLLQMGNCLQHRDYAAAGETYSTILAEFPKSPWAKLARVQKEICQFRLRNQAEETIQDALKNVNRPEDPLAEELEPSRREVGQP